MSGPDEVLGSPALGRAVLASLAAAGVRHVVLAPGSRNAPLAHAAFRADTDGLLTLHVRVDERSAGFLALGLAKGSGSPVAVVTTSGTAVGNLLPAAMEAAASGVPLVVVSADRPAHMVATGANQTADQAGMFGVHARAVARLSSADATLAATSATVHRLVHVAAGTRTRLAGPVQLDVEFDAPLVDTHPGQPWPSVRAVVVASSCQGTPAELEALPHTVVLVGDASPAEGIRARDFAERHGLPLLAEPSSNARWGTHAVGGYRVLLGQPDLGGRIQRVIVFGHPTLSRPVSTLLARDDVQVVIVTGQASWIDPGHRADVVADAVMLSPAGSAASAPAADTSWLNQWRTADHVLRIRLDLHRQQDATSTLTGHDVADLVVQRVGVGQNLVLGASNPIRDADLAPIPDPETTHPAWVFANRGLSGIDGTISTAAGIALATGRPTTCLLGDLTAIHDAGGLWLGRLERRPALRVVVCDDSGGGIFHALEQGSLEHADSFERVFGTPHDVDLVAVAKGFGWDAHLVADATQLSGRLRRPPQGPELLLVRTSRDTRRRDAQAVTRMQQPPAVERRATRA